MNPIIQVAGEILEAAVCRLRGCRVYPPSALLAHEQRHEESWLSINTYGGRTTPRKKRGPKPGSTNASTVAICQKIARVVGNHPNGLTTKELAPFLVDPYRNLDVAKSRICTLLKANRVVGVRVERNGKRGMRVYPL